MEGTTDRITQLIEDANQRLNRAELALNRHGFKQDRDGAWRAPGNPNWAGAMELGTYLQLHYPAIANGPGTLNQKAISALVECEQKRNDAASDWIKSNLPSLKLTQLHLIASPEEAKQALADLEAQLRERTLERDALREHIASQEAITPTPAPPAPPALKVIWPDPKNARFSLDRRDPMSTETRHDSLKRRYDD